MLKLKQMLLGFVKPLLLAHVDDLNQLAPKLSELIVTKSNLTKEQADSLSNNVLDVLKHELVLLLNKI